MAKKKAVKRTAAKPRKGVARAAKPASVRKDIARNRKNQAKVERTDPRRSANYNVSHGGMPTGRVPGGTT